MTSAELAALVSPLPLAAVINAATVPARRARIEAVRILSSRGETAQSIAAALRTDASSLRRTAKRHGITLREDPKRHKPPTSLECRIKRMLPLPDAPAPAVRLRLVEDHRADNWIGRGPRMQVALAGDGVTVVLGIERRRSDCANLDACELAWIEANGAKQARCPETCGEYRKRGRCVVG